jgi:hypothetical protein
MVVSRRSFMKRGSLLVLAAGVSLGSADRIFGRDAAIEYTDPPQDYSPPDENEPTPFNYAKATFTPYVNTVFLIYSGSSNTLAATLVEVSDIGPVPDKQAVGRECFVLKFRGTQTLRQNTYAVEHQVLGRFDLFLVPGGKDKKGVYYQAVINRLNG